jgi:hypothetical protein
VQIQNYWTKTKKKELIEVEIAAYFQRLRSATKTNLNTHTKNVELIQRPLQQQIWLFGSDYQVGNLAQESRIANEIHKYKNNRKRMPHCL